MTNSIREGKERDKVFPKLGGMTSSIGGDGLTVEVRLVKQGGLPVTFTKDPEDEPAAIRMVDLEKKFYLGTYDLADSAGIGRSKAVALRRHLGLDADDDYYSHRFVFGSQKHLRYSDNALRALKEALKVVDMKKIWEAHRPISSNSLKAARQQPCTEPGCVLGDADAKGS